jgi:hypothetical protein
VNRTRPAHTAVRALVVLALVTLWCGALGLSSATAGWSASSAVPGSGNATVGSLLRPSAPAATSSGSTVTLTWTASTRADLVAVSRYTVQRFDTQGAVQTVGGTCATAVAGTGCSETGVPDGTWRYAVTPQLAAWSGPQSPLSSGVLVDATPPSLALPSRTAVSGGSAQTGSTVWFRGVAAGSLTLSSTVTDTGSGPAGAATSALSGSTTGWSHSPGRTTTPAGGPYVSTPLSWSAGTTGSAQVSVTAYDVAGNASAPRVLDLVDDSAPPTGATLALTTGTVTATSTTLALGTVTDGGSGLASRTLYERTAPLSGSTCGTFTSWTAVLAVTTASVTRNLAYQTCYDYSYVVVDRVGNSATVSSPGFVKNRSYAAVVAATTGVEDHYRLGETTSATIADSVVGTKANNGTCTGGPTAGRTGLITADPDTAFRFDGVDDTCTVARSIGGSFSIELWFAAAGPGAGTSTTWYMGAGMVGADVLGLPSDFGVTFLQTGQVCAGTGLLLSLCTTPTYLSGTHHVVFTRDATTGALVLYVDGVSQATGSGGLNLLNGSPNIRLGALKANGPFFNGTLDEVALYTAALPAATVREHYQSGTG